MMDFFELEVKTTKKSGYISYEVSPVFVVCHSKDLMVRGKNFYAVWNDETKLWSTDEYDIVPIVDEALKKKADEILSKHPDANVNVRYLKNYSTGSWDIFKRFISKVSDNLL